MTPFSQLPLADKLKQAQRGDIVVTDVGARLPFLHADKIVVTVALEGHRNYPLDIEFITDIIRPSEVDVAPTISQAMMDVVDRLGSEYDQVDPRCWDHMLVYAPKDTIRPSEQVPEKRCIEMTDAEWLRSLTSNTANQSFCEGLKRIADKLEQQATPPVREVPEIVGWLRKNRYYSNYTAELNDLYKALADHFEGERK